MALYQLPYFGDLEMTSLEEYYQIETRIGEKEVKLDLNFNKGSTDETTMKKIEKFLKIK